MKVIVFLSTGRCGTQFFTTYLEHAAAGRIHVTHEPIKMHYAPKHTLRAPDLGRLLSSYPEVKEHFDEVARITERGVVYVETGWPNFPWIPLFLRRFGDQALVVHLTRNPVRFAFSFASHRFYGTRRPRRHDSYIRLGELHPTDPGVKYPQYASEWQSLNPVEKSLFQWLEVNAWAEELKTAHPDNFVTLRAEDTLAQPELLIEGMIEQRPQLAEVFHSRPAPPGMVDDWKQTIKFEVDSLRYSPEVEQLAAGYGYSMDADGLGIAQRFLVDGAS